jgi:hypothetical protein
MRGGVLCVVSYIEQNVGFSKVDVNDLTTNMLA